MSTNNPFDELLAEVVEEFNQSLKKKSQPTQKESQMSGKNKVVRATFDLVFDQETVDEEQVDKVLKAMRQDLSSIAGFIQYAALSAHDDELKVDHTGAHAHIHVDPDYEGRCSTCISIADTGKLDKV